MNKKTLLTVFSILICLAWVLSSTIPAAAGLADSAAQQQNPTPTPTAVLPTPTVLAPTPTLISIPTENILSFEQLGKAEQFLKGPYDGWTMVFSTPSSWQLTPGAEFDLIFSTSYNNLAGTTQSANQAYGGTLTISLNGVTVSILQIEQTGEHTAHFTIPDKALTSNRIDGRHQLAFSLDSGINCDINQQLTLILKPASRLILPHSIVAPTTDLARFPQPFSQDAAWPDSATIVLPDQPSSAELQSALTVGAALSNLTSASFSTNLTTESKLSATEKAANHLILVGKAASFKLIGELSLPEAISASGLNIPGSGPDDGIIEEVISPWNANKIVLLISGTTDVGVPKASQAVSTGFIRPANKPNVAIIASVDPQPVPQAVPVDQTLADLGYDIKATTDRLNRPGTTSSIFFFYTPPGTVAGAGAYFNLQFSHSALLNFNRSGLIVLLNDQPIGSFRFTETSAQTKNEIKFQIPAPALLPGRNRLEVRTDLIPTDNCTSPNLAGLWVSIWPESLLHMPTESIAAGGASIYDLSLHPLPFTLHPTLGNTSFILAQNDLSGWKTALAIATDLGDRLNGQLITLKAYYADAIPETAKSDDHLIVVGRPAALPLITELNNQLPGPFEAGSEIAIEKNTQVAYRLGPDAKVGFLELLRSPWNNERVILAVLGNSDEGLSQASNALTVSTLRGRLAGDFALITADQITVTDSRIRTSQSIDTTTQLSKPDSGQETIDLSPYQAQQASWILPALVGALALMLITFAIVIISGLRRSRR